MTDTTLDRAVPLSPAAPSAAPAQVQVQAPVQTTLSYVPVQNAALKNAAIIPMSLRSVHFVMPGGVDDPAKPSGGNAYDRRISLDLPGFGWQVHKHAVDGDWPRPGADARAELARTLRELPDGTVVMLDGLVACGVPEIIVPEAERLRLAVLVHLPLGDETGLDPVVAAELDALERTTLRAVAGGHRDQRLGRTTPRLPPRTRPGTRAHGGPRRRHRPLASGTDGVSRLLCVAAVTPARASTGWWRRWQR